MYHLWRRTKKKEFKYPRFERFNKREERKSTHRDTTILSSLDFCYTFLHKRSYQAVVSAGEQLDLTFNRQTFMNSTLKKKQNKQHHRPYLFFAAGQHADNAKTN